MEQAVPCISTNEGGISDIIDDGQTGYLVPHDDAEALAEKMEYLLLHKDEREAMGRRGKVKFEKTFTLERFERRMVDVLQMSCKFASRQGAGV